MGRWKEEERLGTGSREQIWERSTFIATPLPLSTIGAGAAVDETVRALEAIEEEAGLSHWTRRDCRRLKTEG